MTTPKGICSGTSDIKTQLRFRWIFADFEQDVRVWWQVESRGPVEMARLELLTVPASDGPIVLGYEVADRRQRSPAEIVRVYLGRTT